MSKKIIFVISATLLTGCAGGMSSLQVRTNAPAMAKVANFAMEAHAVRCASSEAHRTRAMVHAGETGYASAYRSHQRNNFALQAQSECRD
ncbi:MAG TPA: hypothetical protein VFV22_00305 [Candidatus Paceibacterota bacterium]|nr:hypothetical protein [Candidatus Paceibacterota bacterium]